jgi:23S rRNA-/tRNA-specific pseudouridylate synthase
MNPKIIFEDDDILVLDKPAGWIVNDASTTCKQPTVQNWLVMNFDFPLVENREFRSGIVHRIDK